MQTLVNIKIEDEVKYQAQILAADLGLSLNTIINNLLKQFIKKEKKASVNTYKMKKELENYLKETEEDIKHNRNLYGPIKTKEELKDYFDSL